MKQTLLSLAFLFFMQLNAQCVVTSVSSGEYFGIALMDNGAIFTFGYRSSGALGTGSNMSVITPAQVTNDTDWVSVCTAGYASFAIKSNGTLWATGMNDEGQLGIGTITNTETVFTQVGTDTNWLYVTGSRYHTLGLKTDGTLWSWGKNDHGQLGIGSTTNSNIPVQVGTDTDWVKIATGLNQSIALKSDGTLWVFGYNLNGYLGFFPTGDYNTPIQVGFDTDWVDISNGSSSLHTLLLKSDGSLWVFGGTWNSGDGALGLGAQSSATSPHQIGTDTDWQYIKASFNNSFAIKTNGTLWGWGQNNDGQVGDGTTTDKLTPTQIGTDTDWVMVQSGYTHTYGLKSNGDLLSWGNDSYNQLGNGYDGGVIVPTAIISCTLAQETVTEQELSIYPNPVHDVLTIEMNEATPITHIQLYDYLGRMIFSKPIQKTALTYTVPVQHLPKGLYMVQLKNNDTVLATKKLMKN